ncbi:hypothetical protein MUG94_04190 [Arthrobacter gengyunqii]|uniref:PKD domain-containing protein n=1 Tax=Arthrobacter gengyunqii TaxID=2886940 RepID=A0A9X1M560_9MICC|nr:hypothetical protein [Arthrobacter gengyunqii]MCC3269510.1 hypothetical protein [Arthrobacter gengyunqii]MCC3271005.1 hypothetical protein [Arthrobacter gengyunqii]UOY96986.1 hypothetical protein MUG94_04190 [Arthrobacter gengyunqii]
MESTEDFDWGKNGIGVGGNWGEPSGTDVWTDEPALLNDAYIYSYDPVCFEGDVGNLPCLNANSCDEGPGGQYVRWKRSIRIDPPVWETFVGDGPSCVYSENPQELLEEITSLLLSEFQEHPVNAGKVATQPGPHTMRGAETNIFVDSKEQVIDTVLLGQDVRIVATPSEYVLHYGDGDQSQLTYDAGALLPDPRIGEKTATSHVYTVTGNYQIHATVYFTAAYSLNGGPLIPIDGRGVFDTPAEAISVWKSDSHNVADDCLQNPAGFGC